MTKPKNVASKPAIQLEPEVFMVTVFPTGAESQTYEGVVSYGIDAGCLFVHKNSGLRVFYPLSKIDRYEAFR
jgi:hypothetical protein